MRHACRTRRHPGARPSRRSQFVSWRVVAEGVLPRHRPFARAVLGVAVVAVVLAVSSTQAAAQAADGAELYKRHCATCHDGGVNRAPQPTALRALSAERALAAIETGTMVTMANNRTAAERRAIAEFISGKSLSKPLDMSPSPAAMCKAGGRFDPAAGPRWDGWGHDTTNTRFQETAPAGLTAADVPRLRLKWAFAFPGDLQSYSHATLAGGRLFVGSWGGRVYSLDAASGCIHWQFDAGQGVRAAVSIGPITTAAGARDAAFFGDGAANVYALDAATGQVLWRTRVDDFPVARVSGSPTLHNGRLYVPVASGEEASGAVPTYECCRFRGSIVALDAATGKQIWKTMLVDEPKPTKRNAAGAQLWGPSGVPVWSTPAIDTRLNALYVTTGNNYSDPTSSLSDAFVAMDLDTGAIRWAKQMTASDAYTAACRLPDKTNCAESNGPDVDFGASPILITQANGRRMLVAGQKSGVVHALDPDANGEILWQTRIGKGGTGGGVQWGSATDGSHVYVALSDIGRIMLTYSTSTDADPKQGGGMFALRLADGTQAWHTPPPACGDRPRCSPAQSAAVSAIPGVAFSGSVDGFIRAYSTADGRVVWSFDTIRDYQTANGVPGRGGSLDGPGPVIGGGMMFVNSGYPTVGGTPGNVLLAFTVDGK